MPKKVHILFLFVLFGFRSQAQDYHWARVFGDAYSEYSTQIIADDLGNSYTIGTFTGTVDFDPGPGVNYLTSTSTVWEDTYILKLDSLGNFIWAKRLGGNAILRIQGQGIAIDKAKNPYLTGLFNGIVDFDPSPTTSSLIGSISGGDFFVLKLDSMGNYNWCYSNGAGGSFITPLSISANTGGYIYVGGYFGTYNGNPITFGQWPTYIAVLNSGANAKAFICKLDTSGNVIWVNQHGAPGFGQSNLISLTSNNTGDVYVTGTFVGQVDFDPGTGTYTLPYSAGTMDELYVSKLDLLGNFQWAKALNRVGPASYWNKPTQIIIDNANNVYTSGWFLDVVDFDPGPSTFTIACGGVFDGFITKFDGSGNFLWARAINGPGIEHCNSIALDNSNNLIATGTFNGGADLDPGPATYTPNLTGLANSYLVSLDQNGSTNWMKQFENLTFNTYNQTTSIFTKGQKIYLTGRFAEVVDFNYDSGVALFSSNSSGDDAFIVQLGQCNFPLDVVSPSTICAGQCATLIANGATSYSWNTSSTGAQIIVCPSVTSVFSVTGNISPTCVQNGSVKVTLIPCTEIEEKETNERSITVFPNPFEKKINIESEFEISKITVFDALGQNIILDNNDFKNSGTIDLGNFPKGMYFLNVQSTDSKQRIFKIIKE